MQNGTCRTVIPIHHQPAIRASMSAVFEALSHGCIVAHLCVNRKNVLDWAKAAEARKARKAQG